jgi:hypothetical protein
MFPAQVAEKLPAIELEVALVTCHWKLLQELLDGFPGKIDVQRPPYELPAAGGAGAGSAGAGVETAPGAVGSSRVLLLSTRAHAVANVEAAASAASNRKVLFIVVSLMAQGHPQARLQACVRTHGIVRAAPGN